MPYIKDEELRLAMLNILTYKKRGHIVKEIQAKGEKMHQYHIDRFMNGDDVKLSTLKKLNNYIRDQKK